MPLVAHSELPTFARLRDRGQQVLSVDRALGQDIRELHIGLLNMMPDAALSATEEQFIRMVGNCNQIAQFYVYPFSIPELAREVKAEEHIGRYYSRFEDLQESGLDALIITGANVINPMLDKETFWHSLTEIVNWAAENVASTLCSCLATHALMKHFYNIERQRLQQKKWGVYSHQVRHPEHPLTRGINSRFDAPHSRWNSITRAHYKQAGLTVLAQGTDSGVHMAVSPDQFSFVYFQGHPEYHGNSLLKEYKREVTRFINGELEGVPAHPENYFSEDACDIAGEYMDRVITAQENGRDVPVFPEAELTALVDNTWGDTGKAIFNNWLGTVYQLTSLDRRKRFMSGVDADDPLNLRRQYESHQ
jgi:homoserine O-succinyltransferase